MSHDYLFKILLIGDSSTGKSSILTVYTDQVFTESFMSTIGVDFKIKNLHINNKEVKLQIWDTAGQERFRTITTSYYRGVHGIFIVFDLGDIISFKNLNNWLDEISRYAPEKVPIILLGNKSDLKRVISHEDAKAFADDRNLLYYETSAKTNNNISLCFEKMCELMIDNYDVKHKLEQLNPQIKIQKITSAPKNDENNNCCY